MTNQISQSLFSDAVALLKSLIETPSFSKEEEKTATILEDFFLKHEIKFHKKKNNLWSFNKYFDANKPTILLNSHHDTVKPNPSWTLNPFEAKEQDGKLFGLGSNDAGGCLVALIATFRYFYERTDLNFNLVIAATAEEEISGKEGIEIVLPELPKLTFAIVGEPTLLDLAIAEKGLLVLDCTAHGKAGHAARNEGENALYKALDDISILRDYVFPKVSPLLGNVKVNVTMISAGTQHNVVPDTCSFVADVRVTEQYKLEEVITIISELIQSEVKPRSVRLRASSIPENHAIVRAGVSLGRGTYGSPTMSDQALLNCRSLKMGPGDSARSHTADEFIYLHEIEEGIKQYITMLEMVL